MAWPLPTPTPNQPPIYRVSENFRDSVCHAPRLQRPRRWCCHQVRVGAHCDFCSQSVLSVTTTPEPNNIGSNNSSFATHRAESRGPESRAEQSHSRPWKTIVDTYGGSGQNGGRARGL
jgi:hypothetical protein